MIERYTETTLATKNHISILGCGWLGLPLAKTLVAHGFYIKGSTTSEDKLSILTDLGIEAFLVKLDENLVHGNLVAFLEMSFTLIVDIPPKSAQGSYSEKIKNLIPYIKEAGIKNVLFVSSTSVYGNETGLATEEMVPEPVTENGKQLLEAEESLREVSEFQTTIIRFGGLIGDDRHPVKYLSGKENVENPDAPINLIHREDCLSIIIRIIENKIWGETFNAVAPYHPTREEYYSRKAREMELPLPTFSRKNASAGKQIGTGKLLRFIKYNFLHPEL